MDQRGGCCIARYAGGAGGGGGPYDGSKMDLIMQRFRPIAPKPTPSGESLSPVERSGKLGCVKTGGRGRKRCSGNRGRKKKSISPKKQVVSAPSGVQPDRAVVTLPLLPETPDLMADAGTRPGQLSLPVPVRTYKEEIKEEVIPPRGGRAVVWSSVTVERVTATWGEEEGLGATDEEKMRRLEEDTCPGFISDGWNRVWWTNRAFRDMARQTASFENQGKEEEDVVVWVLMRETEVVPVACQAYTCRVRVQSTWKSGEDGSVPSSCTSSSSVSVTSPCDVWRMRSGGFAWRLDVNAALRLGR